MRKKGPSRKALVKQLDLLYSKAVRNRDAKLTGGVCVLGCGPIECVSHLITRSKYSVRWDLDNGTGQCHSANFRHEFDPHIYTSWYINAKGLDAYNSLVEKSHKIAKFSTQDLLDIKDSLNRLLDEQRKS